MNRFSDFGLDQEKSSSDPGSQGALFCPWCERKADLGLSMCFSNWCICSSCIKEGLELFEKDRHNGRIQKDSCFKNLSGEIKDCFMCIGKGAQIGVCEEVLKEGFEYINKKIFFDSKGQTYLKF